MKNGLAGTAAYVDSDKINVLTVILTFLPRIKLENALKYSFCYFFCSEDCYSVVVDKIWDGGSDGMCRT
jgi:hypothetical protein